jgi:drug/metabolite transporter (DMT)-like permease
LTLWLQFLACVLIWGSTWIAIRYQLGTVPPEWSIVYRFGLASLLTIAVILAQRIRPSATVKQHFMLMIYGLFQFSLNFIFVYHAEKTVPSGMMAVIFGLMVIMNPALARLLMNAPMTSATLAGGLVSVLGVILMFLPQITHFSLDDASVQGLALAFVGVVAACFGNMCAAQPLLKKLPVMTTNLWGMAYGTSFTALYAILFVGPPVFDTRLEYVGGLAFLAIFGSVIAFTFYVNIIRSAGMTVAAYTSVLIPIVALIWSTLDGEFHWQTLTVAGVILALAGLLIAVRRRA